MNTTTCLPSNPPTRRWSAPLFKGLLLTSVSAVLMLSSIAVAEDKAKEEKPKAEEKKPAVTATPQSISYFLGFSVGQQMAQNSLKLSDYEMESFNEGFRAGVERNEPSLSKDELQAAQQAIQQLLIARRKEIMDKMKAKGNKYLAENKEQDGIEVTKSGLQFKVLEAGEGESPTREDTVKVHYTGKLINGKTFDSSRDRKEPATFRIAQVIPGWQEGLQKMKVGSRYMFYIPSDLAYGERGSRGAIGPNEVLVFDVELLEIK